jgi:hypothetical protein
MAYILWKIDKTQSFPTATSVNRGISLFRDFTIGQNAESVEFHFFFVKVWIGATHIDH